MRKCTILSGDKMLGFKKKGGKTGPNEEAQKDFEEQTKLMEGQQMSPEQLAELHEILMKDPDLEKPRRDGKALEKEVMEEVAKIHEMIQQMSPEQQKELQKEILKKLAEDRHPLEAARRG